LTTWRKKLPRDEGANFGATNSIFEYHRGVQTTQAETKKACPHDGRIALECRKILGARHSVWGARILPKTLAGPGRSCSSMIFHDILPGSGIAVN